MQQNWYRGTTLMIIGTLARLSSAVLFLVLPKLLRLFTNI